MVSIKNDVDFAKLKDNSIIGNPKLNNSVINFNGQNNTLYCQKGVELKDATINFNGNNSVIFLSSSNYSYPIKLHVFNNSVKSFSSTFLPSNSTGNLIFSSTFNIGNKL